jgi:DNA-binding NarL/FixJ family response regulator
MKIIFAEDHKLVREGILPFLKELDQNVQIFEAESAEQALRHATEHPDADLVLMDYRMPPGMDGLAAVNAFRDRFPDLPLVVLSGIDELDDIEQVLDAGALGFVEKKTTAQVMLSALRLVLSGGVYIPPVLLGRIPGSERPRSVSESHTSRPGEEYSRIDTLTERQLQVLEQLAQGKPNKLIARALGLQEGTVKMHLATIFRVLNVNNRVEAVIAGQKYLGSKHK